jgi:hypothetical protein
MEAGKHPHQALRLGVSVIEQQAFDCDVVDDQVCCEGTARRHRQEVGDGEIAPDMFMAFVEHFVQ